MIDLFTSLAQGQTVSGKVQPRLPARFEDSTLESAVEAVETEEGPPPHQHDNPQLINALPQPRSEGRAVEPQAAPAIRGIETVIKTGKETAQDSLLTQEYEPSNMPGQAPTAPLHSTVPGQPPTEKPEQAAPPTVRPLSTPSSTIVVQEPSPSAVVEPQAPRRQADTAISPTIYIMPNAPMEAVDTIQAGKGEERQAIESDQQSVEPQVAREAVEPQIMPLSPAAEISAPGSSAHPSSGAPVIEVHIGRVELRQAAPQIQESPLTRPRFEPAQSLSAYLSRRNGGRE